MIKAVFQSVRTGDINGDGYADLLIGAYSYSGGIAFQINTF